ncbi:Na+-translocating ferredoxin:NAD+ oxidoreductase RNF subunit RnfB [Kaistia dalseonensis]|uniref:Na+-translocating ferredoxin:NAD+ oxidoreductase RNF subunit RnfB n=1 Tax=Kaistia dalseonensis TaxID=410840 RepID=A0ABU0H1P5_9HYPH|nr:Na+-translocating ferredoxin:NAD+ oxidoreductase RNF subunit RnfB [Kaistia dalseonensis]
MRVLMMSIALLAGCAGFAGCTSNPNSAAIQAMDNPPNACGAGGSANIEDCSGRR